MRLNLHLYILLSYVDFLLYLNGFVFWPRFNSNAVHNKSVFNFLRTLTTWHCPHSPAARCCWAPGSNRSISPAGRALSNKPAAAACDGRMMGQTDRQTGDKWTDARQLHKPCAAYYVVSAKSTNRERKCADTIGTCWCRGLAIYNAKI